MYPYPRVAQVVNEGVIDTDDERGLVKFAQHRLKQTEGHARRWFNTKRRSIVQTCSMDDLRMAGGEIRSYAETFENQEAHRHQPYQSLKKREMKRFAYKTKKLREFLVTKA